MVRSGSKDVGPVKSEVRRHVPRKRRNNVLMFILLARKLFYSLFIYSSLGRYIPRRIIIIIIFFLFLLLRGGGVNVVSKLRVT